MLRTIAVALAVLAALGSASLLVQTQALGRPTTARLRLVRTVQALSKYGRSTAAIRVGTRRYVTSCRHTYVVANGRVLHEIGGHLAHSGGLDRVIFDLAGCPRLLQRRLSVDLRDGVPVDIRRVRVDGVRSWELRLSGTQPSLELFLSARTELPVELMLEGRRLHARSDVVYKSLR